MASVQSTEYTDLLVRTLKEQLSFSAMSESVLFPKSGPFPEHPLRIAVYPGQLHFFRDRHGP